LADVGILLRANLALLQDGRRRARGDGGRGDGLVPSPYDLDKVHGLVAIAVRGDAEIGFSIAQVVIEIPIGEIEGIGHPVVHGPQAWPLAQGL